MSDAANSSLHLLRDIHLPEPIAWWPPAPGWWMLAVLMCTVIAGVLWRIAANRTPRAQARTQLGQIYADWHVTGRTQDYFVSANRLLRQVAIQQQGREQVARLTGHEWVDWLDSRAGAALTTPTRLALADQCYQPQPQVQLAQVHNEILDWINSSQWSNGA